MAAETHERNRDPAIDILRGIALIIMITANTVGVILIEPHPMWLRFYDSFAAPIFVTLAGFMVAYTGRKYTFSYFLRRGAMIVVVASLIDIGVWQEYPIVSFDVLYVIGLALPVAKLVTGLPAAIQWIVPVAIFVTTPLLQQAFGYQAIVLEVPLVAPPTQALAQAPHILHQVLLSGWFPVFPWLGFALLGIPLARLQNTNFNPHSTMFRLIAGGFLVVGFLVWHLAPGPLYAREGYSEVFFPATFGYLLMAIGVLLAFLAILPRRDVFPALRPLQWLGQCSLFIYVIHEVIIRYVLFTVWPHANLRTCIPLIVIFTAVMLLLAYGVRRFKDAVRVTNWFLRFVLGG